MELEAYVLNTKALTKADVLVTVLTPSGLYRIYGRGYNSLKNKFHILVNRGIKVKLYGEKKGNYLRISDCDLVSTSEILTLDIELFEAYVRIVKLVLYIEHLLDEVSFTLFDFCITELENYDLRLLIDLWKIYLLKRENIILNFQTCGKCHKSENFKTFSLSEGALVCTDCYSNEPILRVEDIRMLNALYHTRLKVVRRGYSQQVSVFLSELVEESIGLKIN